MSAKNFLLDFLNYVFIILLGFLCLLYFIDPVRFEQFAELMRALIPLALFGLVFLIKFKLTRKEFENKKEEGSTDLVLYLDYLDKIKADLIFLALPALVLLIPLVAAGTVTAAEIISAAAIMAGLFFWHRYLWSRAK